MILGEFTVHRLSIPLILCVYLHTGCTDLNLRLEANCDPCGAIKLLGYAKIRERIDLKF